MNFQNKTLDLVLSNLPALSVSPRTFTRKVDKYHSPLSIDVVKISTSRRNLGLSLIKLKLKQVPQEVCYRQPLNYPKADFKAMYDEIKGIDWVPLYRISNNDDAANCLQEKIYEVVSKTVPRSRRLRAYKYPIWLTEEIKQTVKAKEKCRTRLTKHDLPSLREQF
jgi:hypothetical protein